MVTVTVSFERMAKSLASRASLRHAAALVLLAFGVWTAGAAVHHGIVHTDHSTMHGHDVHATQALRDD